MTWAQILSDPKFLLSVGGILLATGVAAGRAEVKFSGLAKKNSDQDKTVLKIAETLKELDAEKADKTDCDKHLSHQGELAQAMQKAVDVALQAGDRRMEQIETMYRDSSQKMENVTTLLVQHIQANGGKI